MGSSRWSDNSAVMILPLSTSPTPLLPSLSLYSRTSVDHLTLLPSNPNMHVPSTVKPPGSNSDDLEKG